MPKNKTEGISFNLEKIEEEEEIKSEVGGREIRGLEPKMERFSILENNSDYKLSWINDRVESELDPADYVLFVNAANGETERMIVPPNWRTVSSESSASFIKKDGKKDYFFVANTKGVGYLKPFVKGESLDDYDSWVTHDFIEGERILGLNNDKPGLKSSVNQMHIANHLIENGLRTEVHWAKAELLKIPFKGEMKSIEELQEMNVFPRKYSDRNRLVRPMELVRLLKTNSRIEESLLADDRRGEIFAESFAVFNREAELHQEREISIGNRTDEQFFFRTFSRRIGNNLAVLFNEGYTHGALHSSNVTMAAEIVDIDPMSYCKHDKKNSGWLDECDDLRLHHIKDIRDLIYSLRRLYKAARLAELSTGSRQSLMDSVVLGFDEMANGEKMIIHDINIDSARNWLKKIAKHVLVDRKNLNSLMHYNIETWEI